MKEKFSTAFTGWTGRCPIQAGSDTVLRGFTSARRSARTAARGALLTCRSHQRKRLRPGAEEEVLATGAQTAPSPCR